MSVQVFDPNSNERPPLRVSMSPRAAAHVKRQLAAMPDGRSLRLGVKESGCSGYMYQLDYIDAPDAGDHPVTIDDELTIYVQNQHLALVRGTEIDYVTEGLNSSLRFKNPNAEAECGCGESFSVGKEVSI
jgi:iron-sulfur cluster assembly accessory protein